MHRRVRRFFVPILLALLLGPLAQGQSPQAPPTVDIQRDIVYATPDQGPQKLDLYLPKGSATPLPIIIYIHGGGWQGGDKGTLFTKSLTQHGFALASINYRFSQVAPWPAQIFDCKAAVRWVRANAAKYGYNADKIGVVGDSAGGHLVAMLGTTANDPSLEGTEGNAGVSSTVQAVVDLYGPSDFLAVPDQANPEQLTHITPPVTHLFGGPIWGANADPARVAAAKQASPVNHVSATSCPFFIAHGALDSIVPVQQAQELDHALKAAGATSTLVVIADKGHAFGFNDHATTQGIIAFLRQQLGAK